MDIHTRSRSEAGLIQVHQQTGKVGEEVPCWLRLSWAERVAELVDPGGEFVARDGIGLIGFRQICDPICLGTLRAIT